MKSIFTYIFKNNYYNDVISKYDEIKQKYLEAYKIWSSYHSVSDNGKFETKEIIANAYSDIKQVDSWKSTYNYLKRNKEEGLKWFSKEKSLSYPTKKVKSGTDNYRLRIWLADTSLVQNGSYSVEVDINGKAK